ncbi:MAG TPA: GDSL family lipase [Candidatus Avidesulfovibrio excrementigallinarum]|nr:GDSL family lipase [Candidatus Avidesulfovibrio excrementigallinarum]
MKHLLFFGDSILLGVGEPGRGGWVGRLAEGLVADGRLSPATSSIYNLGVRRASSRQIQARWHQEFAVRRGLTEVDCALLLFSFGVVDMAAPKGTPNMRMEESVQTAKEILISARDAAPVLLVGPTPVAGPEHAQRIETLSQKYDELCAQLAVGFVDLFTPLARSEAFMGDLPDGVHPGSVGNELIARQVLASDGLRAWLNA